MNSYTSTNADNEPEVHGYETSSTDSDIWTREVLEEEKIGSVTEKPTEFRGFFVDTKELWCMYYDYLRKFQNIEDRGGTHKIVLSTMLFPQNYEQNLDETFCLQEQHADITETGTTKISLESNVSQEVLRAIEYVGCLDLNDEIENEFCELVLGLLQKYGNSAVCEFNYFIRNNLVTSEVADFILRILGDLDHEQTHSYRRWLLENVLLNSKSITIKDSANIGLALMNDPQSLDSIQKAINEESSEFMKKLLKKTFIQLEKINNALISEANQS